MQSLQTVTKPVALSEAEKLRLLELQDLELQLEQEARRRQAAASELPASNTVTLEAKHQAFMSAYPFKKFVEESFQVVEPSRQFVDNWHIDIICELLMAVVLGQVRNFIINQPRRTMKSLLTCVMFPAWVWTFLPWLRFLFTSYSKTFAERDNEKTKELILSDYYQNRFGTKHILVKKTKQKIQNNKGGFRIIFRIGKGVGEGGDIVISDDPNDIEETESDTQLDRTNRGWDEISSQNVADRRTAARGINQQRTNPDDLTGHILERPELKALYTAILCLPNRFETDHPDTNTPERPLRLGVVTEYDKASNPALTIGDEKLWIDPRQIGAKDYPNVWYQHWFAREFTARGYVSEGEGQLLWPSYQGEKETLDAENHLGIYGTSAQMQQRPIRRGGNFFNSENFPLIGMESIDFDNMTFCRYWDKAGSDGSGDWTVGLLLARTNTRPYTFYVVDLIREQVGYYERQELIKNTAERDTADFIEEYPNNEYTVVIEREPASSGKDLATLERDELVGYDVFIDQPKKKKGLRAKPVRSFSESGRIKVVKAAWNTVFFRRVEKFDANKDNQKDDEIDTLSGGFRFLNFGKKKGKGYHSGTY